MRNPLTDSQKELKAIVTEAVEEAGTKTAGPTMTPIPSKTSSELLQHQLDCWRDEGPLGKLRNEVNEIKMLVRTWGKGLVIAVGIIAFLNAYMAFNSKFGPVPLPSAAHAAEGK